MDNKIKIAYFPKNTERDKVIAYNGKALDNYCVSAKTTENIETATYTLDAEFAFDESIKNLLQEEAILKCRLDYGDEIFRIIKVNKTTRKIIIVANQITIQECKQLFLEDVRPTKQNGLSALNWMYNNAVGRKDIFISSNIANINSANYQNKNLQEAIYGSDNSFVSKWGGETLRRGYNITINTKIGQERGVTIREKKNLTGLNVTTNLDDLCTRAKGKGYNGLEGRWVDSGLIEKYKDVYTKVIEYPNVKIKGADDEEGFNTEEEAIAELDKLVKAEFEENNIDVIKATYTINFAQLERCEEYKDYVQAEKIYLGDTIRVYVPKLDIDIKVRAKEKIYDVMAQKTEEITVSNTDISSKMSASSIINSIKNMLSTNSVLDLSSYIDATIKAGMKNSYVVVRNGELLAMDSEDINSAINVTRLNKNGLGFSSTGYYGEYTYGFTLDGKINASLISTGILSTILIQNADGSFRIDLSGSGGASFLNNNKLAMKIERNALNFYDWKDSGYIGSLGSTRNIKKDKPFIELWNEITTGMSFGYRNSEGTISPYFRLDKYGIIDDNAAAVIKFFENLGLVNYKDLIFFGNDYSRPLGLLALGKDNNMHLCCGKETDDRKLFLGAIKEDDMNSFVNWIGLSKDRIELLKKLYVTTTWGGKTGLFSMDSILSSINNTLDNFNERLNNLENK